VVAPAPALGSTFAGRVVGEAVGEGDGDGGTAVVAGAVAGTAPGIEMPGWWSATGARTAVIHNQPAAKPTVRNARTHMTTFMASLSPVAMMRP